MTALHQPASVLKGTGRCRAHHGEILQGVFPGGDGRLHRGLITMPQPDYYATAVFTAGTIDGVQVCPLFKAKAKRAAELALRHLEVGTGSWRLYLSGGPPVGLGMGSSTGDVVATIRAVADFFDRPLAESEVAVLAVRSEVASDAVMFDRPVLFAQREGVVLEEYTCDLPALRVLSINTDQAGGGVDTTAFTPARYDSDEIETFRCLKELARRAINRTDLELLAVVATRSAEINQRFLPTPQFDRLRRVGGETGALGVQVAHTGTVMGLIYPPDGGGHGGIQVAREELDAVDNFRTSVFSLHC